ncbi:MAG: hypothetical protein RLW62_16075 [Gammaproteobacteria bacterium]
MVLHTTPAAYVLVECRWRGAIALGDIIAGDLMLADVKWFLNISRDLLIEICVLGHFATLAAAVMSAAPRPAAAARACPPRALPCITGTMNAGQVAHAPDH